MFPARHPPYAGRYGQQGYRDAPQRHAVESEMPYRVSLQCQGAERSHGGKNGCRPCACPQQKAGARRREDESDAVGYERVGREQVDAALARGDAVEDYNGEGYGGGEDALAAPAPQGVARAFEAAEPHERPRQHAGHEGYDVVIPRVYVAVIRHSACKPSDVFLPCQAQESLASAGIGGIVPHRRYDHRRQAEGAEPCRGLEKIVAHNQAEYAHGQAGKQCSHRAFCEHGSAKEQHCADSAECGKFLAQEVHLI